MKNLSVADVTMRENTAFADFSLSFKEKLEIVKQMEKLEIDVIEIPALKEEKTDLLFIKSLGTLVKNSIISCDAGRSKEDVDKVWGALGNSVKPRLRVTVPTSAVQMEYVYGMKPPKVMAEIKELVAYAKSLCADVEFSAEDATRSEMDFLAQAVQTAIEEGATVINICDSAGVMLPEEFKKFVETLMEKVPELEKVTLSVECSDELKMANANVFAGVAAGAVQVKVSAAGVHFPALETIVHAIAQRGSSLNIGCNVRTVELQRALQQLSWLSGNQKNKKSPFAKKEETGSDAILDQSADLEQVSEKVKELGYELSAEDTAKVFEAFKRVVRKKKVNARELDAIVATSAMQVPPTYQVVDYVINSGNIITPTANIALVKDGRELRGLSTGDGPVEAAFMAIENIVGTHYELDDFQIQAITEGSEAAATALVRLRANGQLFSGTGISTDINGASIRAYVSALNKIVYEDETV